MWLAIFLQGLEAFVLLALGPLLLVLFLSASGIAAFLLRVWLRYLLASDRQALLFTFAAAAVVPWVSYWLFPMGDFNGIGLLLGLALPYAAVAILLPFLIGIKRVWGGIK